MTRGTLAAARILLALWLVAPPSAARQSPSAYELGSARLRVMDGLAAREAFKEATLHDRHSAAAWLGLSEAAAILGDDEGARESAQRASGLVARLPDTEPLVVEARLHETNGNPERAVELYSTLQTLRPTNPGYGLAVARAQIAAGKPKDALQTIDSLRRLSAAYAADPRLDLIEGAAASALNDVQRQSAAARRAGQKAAAHGWPWIAAEAKLLEAGVLIVGNDLPRAEVAVREARQLCEGIGYVKGVATATALRGEMFLRVRRMAEAGRAYREALAAFRRIGDRAGQGRVLWGLAWLEGELGNDLAAKERYLECVSIREAIGDRAGVAQALSGLGYRRWRLRELREARAATERSLAFKRELGLPLTNTMRHLGIVWQSLGELGRAKAALDEELLRAREGQRAFPTVLALTSLGQLALAEGSHDRARKYLGEAAELGRQLPPDSAALMELTVANALFQLEEGKHSEAERLARIASESFGRSRQVGFQSQALSILARALSRQDKHAEALLAASRALKVAESAGDRIGAALAEARVRTASGRPDEAAKRLTKVLKGVTKSGDVESELETRLALGEAEMASGRIEAGARRLTALEEEARARGFMLVVRKAAARLSGGRVLTSRSRRGCTGEVTPDE